MSSGGDGVALELDPMGGLAGNGVKAAAGDEGGRRRGMGLSTTMEVERWRRRKRFGVREGEWKAASL